MSKIVWRDNPITIFSEFDAQRRFFRIDRGSGPGLLPRYALTWQFKPSAKRHSKIHTLRMQKDIRSVEDAKQLAEQWLDESLP
jgi:hypothetical protein